MAQIITNSNGGGAGGGGGDGDMKKSVYDPQNIAKDAFDYDNFTNTPTIPTDTSDLTNGAGFITSSALSGYQTTSNLVTDLTNPDDTHYPSAKAVSDAITSAGGGDMLKSVYDPNNVAANAFDYNNFINTPTIPAAQVQSDWDESDNTQVDYIKNKPTIPTVNNSTIEIQKNGTKVKDFTLNQSSGETINITVPTDTSDLTNGAGFVTSSIINDTAYGSSWDSDTTHSPTKNAVYDKISSMDTAIGGNTTDISTINGKIPSAATSSNQLADKDYVNDGINSVTAYYITKNAQGDQWATRAELFAATTFYSGGVVRVPTKNDYTIVLSDEQHDNATTRYIYNSGWEYQYTVNETALTQAQLDALNSGITSGKVSTYDGYATSISGKQDSLTLPATPTQGHLVTWGADNKTLVDGGAIPTGVPSGGNNGDVLTNVSGTPTWQAPTGGNGIAKIFNMPSANSNISDIVYWIYSNAGSAILKENLGTGLSQDFVYYDVTELNYDSHYLISVSTVGGITTQKKINYTVNSGIYTCSTIETTSTGLVPTTGTTNYVLTKTANGYEWQAPSGGDVMVSSQSGNILTSGMKIWAGTEADYGNLGTYDSNTVYLTV